MARGKPASSDLSAPEPTFRWKMFVHFAGNRRSGPILNFGFGDIQRSSIALHYPSEIIKYTRPKLRHERTLINSINEFRVHRVLVSITAKATIGLRRYVAITS